MRPSPWVGNIWAPWVGNIWAPWVGKMWASASRPVGESCAHRSAAPECFAHNAGGNARSLVALAQLQAAADYREAFVEAVARHVQAIPRSDESDGALRSPLRTLPCSRAAHAGACSPALNPNLAGASQQWSTSDLRLDALCCVMQLVPELYAKSYLTSSESLEEILDGCALTPPALRRAMCSVADKAILVESTREYSNNERAPAAAIRRGRSFRAGTSSTTGWCSRDSCRRASSSSASRTRRSGKAATIRAGTVPWALTCG